MARTPTARQLDLLDRLTDLLLAEGFAHLTLDQMAGRLRCSKTTLYALADSKDQLAVRVVGHFFRRCTTLVEARVSARRAPRRRLEAYLDAIAEALEPASRQFITDVAAFGPTRQTTGTTPWPRRPGCAPCWRRRRRHGPSRRSTRRSCPRGSG